MIWPVDRRRRMLPGAEVVRRTRPPGCARCSCSRPAGRPSSPGVSMYCLNRAVPGREVGPVGVGGSGVPRSPGRARTAHELVDVHLVVGDRPHLVAQGVVARVVGDTESGEDQPLHGGGAAVQQAERLRVAGEVPVVVQAVRRETVAVEDLLAVGDLRSGDTPPARGCCPRPPSSPTAVPPVALAGGLRTWRPRPSSTLPRRCARTAGRRRSARRLAEYHGALRVSLRVPGAPRSRSHRGRTTRHRPPP